ncbi:MAG: helix-turn-helix transcriptional regulator [Oscillospiraceae bacterium]|nr:helix-turn-helix transcriptional regulator [Oscillospiraceae bacterium]
MLQNLKHLREKNGVTQQQLAAAVGVSQQSINKYENHNIEPDIRTLIAISDFFQVSVDYLIGHVYESENTQNFITLNVEELKLIRGFRGLTPKEKDSILLILENYQK